MSSVPPTSAALIELLQYIHTNIKSADEYTDMNETPNRLSEFFDGGNSTNLLWQYVQNMNPETIAQLSKPDSADVLQVMERNIIGLLGGLPAQHFDVTVTTSREHLGRLLASAMMSGYFLRNAEQRLNFERSLQAVDSSGANGVQE